MQVKYLLKDATNVKYHNYLVNITIIYIYIYINIIILYILKLKQNKYVNMQYRKVNHV